MTYHDLWHRLCGLYDLGEAKAIIRLVLEEKFSLSLADVICGKVNELSLEESAELEKIMVRLEKGEPVQYVLGSAYFCGRDFFVASGVLIPRPETQQLCEMIVEDHKHIARPPRILDIGTGSGCIAVTLALDLPSSEVTAWDYSAQALGVASENNRRLQSGVKLVRQDVFSPPDDSEEWDVVVSNPPYICRRESQQMEPHVLEHEPDMALFVPDEDPLRFYSAITDYALAALKKGGKLYFEINPLYAEDMRRMMEEKGMRQITIIEDMFGKERFAKAQKAGG